MCIIWLLFESIATVTKSLVFTIYLIGIWKEIQRVPLFHDLILNNGNGFYFRFDDYNKNKSTRILKIIIKQTNKVNTNSPIYFMNIIERIDLILDTICSIYMTSILQIQYFQIVCKLIIVGYCHEQTNEYSHWAIMYSITRAHHKTAQW